MATDRYSDNHTISVSGGAGTLTVDGNLQVTGSTTLSSDGNINITAENDINLTTNTDDIKIAAADLLDLRGENLQVLIANFTSLTTGGSASASVSDTLNVNANEANFSAGDISLSASTELNLSANNDVNITADQLNIELTGTPERINILNATSTCDIRFDSDTNGSVALPASAFQITSSGDGENTGLVLNLNGGSGHYQTFYAPLPDSIPNGSQIAQVGLRYRNDSSSNDGSAIISIQSLNYESSNSYTTLDSNTFTLTASENEYISSAFLANIDKSKPNHIQLTLSGNADLFVYCVTLSYQTNRINININ